MNPSYNVLDYEDPDYNLAYEVNTGLKQEVFDKEGNPTGEFGPGPNVRDPETLEIVPREEVIEPLVTAGGEGITQVTTPVEDTGLSEAEIEATAEAERLAELERAIEEAAAPDDAIAQATYEAQAGPDVLAGVTTGDAGAAEKFYQENP